MFQHRLAGHLSRTVEELEDMDSAEYTRWIAFDIVSPIGGERWDYLFTWLVTRLFGSKAPKFSELLPKWGRGAKKPEGTKEDLLAWVARVKAKQAKKVKHGH